MTGRSENLLTPQGRLAFTVDLFKARKDETSGRERYGCTILFPKGTNLSALEKAALDAARGEWGDKAEALIRSGTIKSPFLDGDGPQGVSKKTGERHAGFAGHTFVRITANVDHRPQVFDRRRNPVMDASDCPSGYYGAAVVHAYTWEHATNGRGITFGVSMVQVQKEGELLGGGGPGSPDQWFEQIEDAGSAPAETKTGKGAAGLFG